MTTKMNLNGTTRKALVAAIAEITGDQPIYRKVPTCNYDIGEITVTKDGSIVCPDRSDIMTSLTAAGFFPEEAEIDGGKVPSKPESQARYSKSRKYCYSGWVKLLRQ